MHFKKNNLNLIYAYNAKNECFDVFKKCTP